MWDRSKGRFWCIYSFYENITQLLGRHSEPSILYDTYALDFRSNLKKNTW